MRIDMNFARDIIRCIDRIAPERGNFSVAPETFLAQDEFKKYNYSSAALDRHLDYCEQQGYFHGFKRYVSDDFALQYISQKGYDFLDEKETVTAQSPNSKFNIGNITINDSTVGENITQSFVHSSTYGDNAFIDQSITNNFGANLDEIEKLISAKPSADQEQLIGLLALLKTASEKDAPISKGLLSKFSDCLKKHTDIITAIGNWAVAVLTAGQ